jgi:hypothetical protein
MKQFFTIILLFFAFVANAQETIETTAPKWVPADGYWVAESNKANKHQATMYFYNNDHTLIYKETIAHRRFNLNKRRTLMHLKSVLDTAIALHRDGKTVEANSPMLAYRFK